MGNCLCVFRSFAEAFSKRLSQKHLGRGAACRGDVLDDVLPRHCGCAIDVRQVEALDFLASADAQHIVGLCLFQHLPLEAEDIQHRCVDGAGLAFHLGDEQACLGRHHHVSCHRHKERLECVQPALVDRTTNKAKARLLIGDVDRCLVHRDANARPVIGLAADSNTSHLLEVQRVGVLIKHKRTGSVQRIKG